MVLVNRDQNLKIHHITNFEQNVRFFAHPNVYGILIAQSNEFAIWKSDVRAASTVYRCLEASQTKDDIFTPLKQA